MTPEIIKPYPIASSMFDPLVDGHLKITYDKQVGRLGSQPDALSCMALTDGSPFLCLLDLICCPQGAVEKSVVLTGNVMYAIIPQPNTIRAITFTNGSLALDATDEAVLGPTTTLLVRGINMEGVSIFTDLVKGCAAFLIAMVVIQFILSLISIDSFIRPLEKAAAYLKINRKVDIKLVSRQREQSNQIEEPTDCPLTIKTL